MIELSLNEVETTVVKAACGRGLDHGVATEIGTAARWLCEAGHDGIEAAVEALAAVDGDGGELGLAAVDLALASEEPVLVSDYVSRTLLAGLAGRVGLVSVDVDDGVELRRPAELAVSPAQVATVASPPCWSELQDWAAQTYVPSSEQSRVAGAGAGLTDND